MRTTETSPGRRTGPEPRDTASAASRVTERDSVDDDRDELTGTGPLVAVRDRERARCAAIMCSPAGRANPALALALAGQTRLTRHEALAFLEANAIGSSDACELAVADRDAGWAKAIEAATAHMRPPETNRA